MSENRNRKLQSELFFLFPLLPIVQFDAVRQHLGLRRGQGDVPMEPGNTEDQQVAVRHADASGSNITEKQHEEDRMRDIHVGTRGSEAAGEEEPDKLRKTVRFKQGVPSAAASSDPTVALECPASGETQDRPGSVLVQKSGHVDDDVQTSALDPFYEMDLNALEGKILEK